MADIVIQAEAREEFISIYGYLLEQGSETIADNFEDSFDKGIRMLSKTPLAGRVVGSMSKRDVRHWVVGSYKIYYQYYTDSEIVLILSIRHQSMQNDRFEEED